MGLGLFPFHADTYHPRPVKLTKKWCSLASVGWSCGDSVISALSSSSQVPNVPLDGTKGVGVDVATPKEMMRLRLPTRGACEGL